MLTAIIPPPRALKHIRLVLETEVVERANLTDTQAQSVFDYVRSEPSTRSFGRPFSDANDVEVCVARTRSESLRWPVFGQYWQTSQPWYWD